MRVSPFTNTSGKLAGYSFQCPGCAAFAKLHPIPPWDPPGAPEVMASVEEMRVEHLIDVGRWTFNGDLERPTFSPSLLVYHHHRPDGFVCQPRCHSFVRDGRIEFLADCEHPLAGQTVDLPDIAESRS